LGLGHNSRLTFWTPAQITTAGLRTFVQSVCTIRIWAPQKGAYLRKIPSNPANVFLLAAIIVGGTPFPTHPKWGSHHLLSSESWATFADPQAFPYLQNFRTARNFYRSWGLYTKEGIYGFPGKHSPTLLGFPKLVQRPNIQMAGVHLTWGPRTSCGELFHCGAISPAQLRFPTLCGPPIWWWPPHFNSLFCGRPKTLGQFGSFPTNLWGAVPLSWRSP